MSVAPTYAFFGAAPDTDNRGVSALFRCVVEGLADYSPDSGLLVFDNARGVRRGSVQLASGGTYNFTRIGARGGRRYYAQENLATMAAFSAAGRTFGRLHPVVRALDRCKAILDISGGDSFSDIYGSKRFASIVRPKLIAQRLGIPLVLLPQTYGPFQHPRTQHLARKAATAATIAWARDARSLEALEELLGPEFDRSRHRAGVDMAFNLRGVDPGEKLDAETRRWLEARSGSSLLGLNLSGLVALDPGGAKRDFGLRTDYMSALTSFIGDVLRESDRRLLLIPHVMSPIGSPGSDAEACVRVLAQLSPHLQSRVRVTPTNLDECEVKWVISNLDWFSGTRMHSTIAALSSRVPTAALAYSIKTRGVFESCGVGDQVIELRHLETRDVVKRLMASFEGRAEVKRVLDTNIEGVQSRAREQLDYTVRALKELD